MNSPALLRFEAVDLDVYPRPRWSDLARLRAYGPGRAVLRGVTLTLDARERVALLGANGAGKTTLLRAAAGLLLPTSGQLHVAGRAALGVADERTFQRRLSVRAHLEFMADLLGTPREEIAPLLDSTGLGPYAQLPAEACSGGVRARLGLARSLLGSPSVLLLDEIERGLDAGGRRDLAALLQAERSGLVVFATHDPALAALATRTLRVESGQVDEVASWA
jgi:ABC-type multidrug transport system ATPase subunit